MRSHRGRVALKLRDWHHLPAGGDGKPMLSALVEVSLRYRLGVPSQSLVQNCVALVILTFSWHSVLRRKPKDHRSVSSVSQVRSQNAARSLWNEEAAAGNSPFAERLGLCNTFAPLCGTKFLWASPLGMSGY
jgi:hypothetical protein